MAVMFATFFCEHNLFIFLYFFYLEVIEFDLELCNWEFLGKKSS